MAGKLFIRKCWEIPKKILVPHESNYSTKRTPSKEQKIQYFSYIIQKGLQRLPDTHRDPNRPFRTQTRAEKTHRKATGPIQREKIRRAESWRQVSVGKSRQDVIFRLLSDTSASFVARGQEVGFQSTLPTPPCREPL